VGKLMMEPIKTPKQRQRKYEEEHKLEQAYMKGHNDPRCLKWGEEEFLYIR
jgi:hypothetical protein